VSLVHRIVMTGASPLDAVMGGWAAPTLTGGATFNATGDVDIRWYYDGIAGDRERTLRPRLNRLVRLIMLAKDGLDALERLALERPAIVLSDIEMPRMDGFEFVRKLRADPDLQDLPVIMITSRIAQKHRDHAAQLGVEHYLGKPYSEEKLLALITQCMSRETEAQGA
jgi:CheY-like chemotaxis protein